jgi:hypothetical protein
MRRGRIIRSFSNTSEDTQSGSGDPNGEKEEVQASQESCCSQEKGQRQEGCHNPQKGHNQETRERARSRGEEPEEESPKEES